LDLQRASCCFVPHSHSGCLSSTRPYMTSLGKNIAALHFGPYSHAGADGAEFSAAEWRSRCSSSIGKRPFYNQGYSQQTAYHLHCSGQSQRRFEGWQKADFAVLSINSQFHCEPLAAMSTQPLDVSLLLDVSISQKGMLDIYSDALHGLIAALDKTRDHIAIYTCGSDVRLYQDWEPAGSIDAESIKVLDHKKVSS
jgi:hypothetical protein